ncbi:FkbM family methyltransferase [Christiangramia echinicola]|uniref:Methyltransferase, FkbM family n=1 Tax=Christiangramia echinicola TaxID=279359 RepID=A0A1H1KWW4_9FLAO|nr:FkbM family methyltransferase [Christiangramia echinicola]SDR66275.1 methyltransferase, FkbM family [Christiangramia echinicola]
MKRNLIKYISKAFSYLGYKLITNIELQKLLADQKHANELKFILSFQPKNLNEYFKIRSFSKSQLRQDLFVLNELNFKNHGYFVEFGGCDGLHHSNTYLLEKEFDWKGIIAEPAKIWHNELEFNRKVFIDKNCVWSETNHQLEFNEPEVASLSTIKGFGENDNHKDLRHTGKKYSVNTISLTDLLKKYNAPKIIDYLSIDTEGSELEILKNFNFDEYKFRIITVEHNYTEIRANIYDLLINKGYRRVKEKYSEFDDWYVLRS